MATRHGKSRGTKASAPEKSAFRISNVPAALIAEAVLKVSGQAFSYCPFEDDGKPGCDPMLTLQIGKAPLLFWVQTQADASLKDRDVNYDVAIQNLDGTTIFETYWSTKLTYIPDQVTRVMYKDVPPALKTLAPGRYKFYASVTTTDGQLYDERQIVIPARK